jgi:hypothetical protein
MSQARREIEKRATRAMLVHSFYHWKSAVVIALTILMSVVFKNAVEGLFWTVWPAFGLMAEIALAWGNLNDPEFGRRVVAEMLQQEFSPRTLQDKSLRHWIEQALEYRGRIETNIRATRDGVLKDHLLDVADEIENWIKNVYQIASRLDTYRADDVIKRDRQSVPVRLKNLELQLAQEKDPAVRAQIQATMRNQKTHLAHLERLVSSMQRAELQLESTLSALGTVYSQTLLVGARDIDSSRAQRLRKDIADQVSGLEDLITAMDEVYADSAAAP